MCRFCSFPFYGSARPFAFPLISAASRSNCAISCANFSLGLSQVFSGLQDEEPMVLNDEEDLKRQQAAERARERQERLRDA